MLNKYIVTYNSYFKFSSFYKEDIEKILIFKIFASFFQQKSISKTILFIFIIMRGLRKYIYIYDIVL